MPRYLIKVDAGKRLTRDQKDAIFSTVALCLQGTVYEAFAQLVEDGELDSIPKLSIMDTEIKREV